MTTIQIYKNNNLFTGFEVKGHTGKADKGSDLLCCQLSTIAQFAVLAIQEVAKASAFVQVSDGYLKLHLSVPIAAEEKIQFLLCSCYEAFRSILTGEAKYAKMEVKDDVFV